MDQFDYSRYVQDAEITARESYLIKDGAGGRSIFDLAKIQNVPRFKPSIGVHVIDIVMAPAGEHHPLVVAGKLRPEQLTHMCWVYVHKGIGPNQDWFICLARTYGKACPACEQRNKLMADPNVTQEAANVYGSGKYPIGIYNIIHHLNPNQITWSEPVMVWDINNAFMESHLQSRAKQPMVTPDNPTGYINYMWPTAGPQGGRHVKFEVVQKGQFFDYKGHDFIVRNEPIPPHVLSSVYTLGDLLHIPTYEEVKDAIEAGLQHPIGGEPTGATVAPVISEVPFWEGPQTQPVFGTPETKCPFANYGGVLGESFDTWEECENCEFRVACEEAKKRLEETHEETHEEPPELAPPQPKPKPKARKPIPRRPQK